MGTQCQSRRIIRYGSYIFNSNRSRQQNYRTLSNLFLIPLLALMMMRTVMVVVRGLPLT